MKNLKKIIPVISLFFAQNIFAAFDVAPIIVTAAPSGSGATVTIQATNNGDAKTPIQIAIVHREPDIDGKEDYEKSKDAGDLFQIIPSQVILGPKEKRSIRITYIGEPRLKIEQACRFIAEEFPIDVSDPTKVKDKAVANISIVSRYVGSLYVKPAGVSGQLTFDAVADKNPKDQKMIITIKNTGTEHKILNDTKYTFITTADKKIYPWSAETLKDLGNHNILPGNTRKIIIPWPKEIPVGPVKIVAEIPPPNN